MRPLSRLIALVPPAWHFSAALRGTLAIGTPLLALNALGHPMLATLATIGALLSTLSDVGGSYRSRLLTLLLASALIPTVATLGSVLMTWWWVATLGMAALTVAVGLARSFGQLGTSLGFSTGISYLLGTALGGGSMPPLQFAGGVLIGSAWALCVTLVLWQLRPYKSLEYEVADCFAKVAALVYTAAHLDPAPPDSSIAQRHYDLRQTIERSRQSFGEVSTGTDGPRFTLPRLLVLVRSAARIGANAVTLTDIQLSDDSEAETAQATYARAVQALAEANRGIVRSLNRGRLDLDLQPLEEALNDRLRRWDSGLFSRSFSSNSPH